MRMLLGVSVSLSEAEVQWRAFLEGLRKRGLEVTKLITSDDHAGLRAARRAVFPNLPWQRCQFHLQQNAQAYVPNVTLRPQVARDLLVEKYRRPAPKLRSGWRRTCPRAWPSSRCRSRTAGACTTNALERLNRELHRRTRVATLFPNENSLLRLVSAMAGQREKFAGLW